MSDFSISGGADAQLLKWEYIDPQGRRVVSLIDQETYDALVRSGRIKPNDQAKPGPIGNTQGIIVPDTSPNTSGSSSAPPPSPTEAEEGWWKRWGSGVTHGALDVIGMIPVIGEPANLIGAGIYALEGDYTSAALDLAAMWPAGGQAATVAKNARNVGGAVLEQAEKRAAREAAEAAERRAVREAEERAAREAQEQAQRRADNAAPPKKKDDGGNVRGDPRCRLRKYSQGCPGGQTPHHVVPDRAFKMPDQTRLPGGLSHGDGFTICVDGGTPVRRGPRANEHGLIHAAYDPAEALLGAKGNPRGTATLGELEILAVATVSSVTKCNPATMLAELRSYHQSKGLSVEMRFRADPNGSMIRGTSPSTLGKTSIGLGGI